jgi:hypothetical protein
MADKLSKDDKVRLVFIYGVPGAIHTVRLPKNLTGRINTGLQLIINSWTTNKPF